MKQITKILALMLFIGGTFTSCNWVKEKSKKTINKTGEVVGKTSSEFGEGVYKGVKKTFENKIKLSENLQQKGIEIGEVTVHSTDSTTDNILTVYMIFNEDFERNVKVKIYDGDTKEYGRTTKNIKGTKEEAKYVDFVFDGRVKIGSKGNVVIE